MVGEVQRLHAREPRILRDGRQLRQVQQRLERSAYRTARHVVVGQHLDAHAGRHLVGRAMLVKRLAADAVWIALHDEGTVRHHRQDEGRDLHVVPHQVALGETLAGPEDLVEVADLQRVAIGQRERGLGLALGFDTVELVDDELKVRGDAAELKFSPPGCLVLDVLASLRPRASRLRAFAPSRLRDCGSRARAGRQPRLRLLHERPTGFTSHGLGVDVVPQPEICGMAQPALVGPLGEAHLRHQLGLHPVRRLVGRGRRHVKGRRLALERCQQPWSAVPARLR